MHISPGFDMKQLQLQGQAKPVPLSETHKESLIRAIAEFVGPDGCLAFEHGFNPAFNAQMITDKEVVLRHRIGRNRRSRIPLSELDENQLTILIVDIFKYQNHVHLRA